MTRGGGPHGGTIHVRQQVQRIAGKLVLGVPPKDVQVILGHAHVSTTNQIYTHVDEAAKRDALTRLNKLLSGDDA